MTVINTVNRIFREFKRYTGDGLPGEPTNAALPVGDPQSGPHSPKKSELRAGFAEVFTGLAEDVARADQAASRAEEYAALIGSATNRLSFTTVSSLLTDATLVYTAAAGKVAVGTGDVVEAQGYRYEVAASGVADQHITTAGGVKLYIVEPIWSPFMLGGAGDGVADDQSAVRKCILSGRPVEWGGPNVVWRVTLGVTENLNFPVQWVSRGATIRYDGAPARDLVNVNVGPYVHKIDGILNLDGGSKVHVGFRMDNIAGSTVGGSRPTLIAPDLRVRNIRRHSLGLAFGSGINVDGAWQLVDLDRAVVENVTMVEAAHSIGVQGIDGIRLSRTGAGDIKEARIGAALVRNVWSESPTVFTDQDGIVLFGVFFGLTTPMASDSRMSVDGARIENVRGRSIKCQGHHNYISNVHVIKDAAIVDPGAIGVAVGQGEIEIQYGGGHVRNIEFRLNGYANQDLVRILQISEAGTEIPAPIVDGIRGQVRGVIPRATVFVEDATKGPRKGGIVSNVSIDGKTEHIIFHNESGAPTGLAGLTVSNLHGSPTVSGIVSWGFAEGSILGTNIVNHGPRVPLFQAPSSLTSRTGKLVNSQGFSGGEGPTTTDISLVLDGDTRTIYAPVRNGWFGGIAEITCQTDNSSRVQFRFDNAGVEIINQKGVFFTAGTTAEPGSGPVRLWVDVANKALKVTNRSGLYQTFAVHIVG